MDLITNKESLKIKQGFKTDFCKFNQKKRKEKNMILGELADLLNVGAARLSGAEYARRGIPQEWEKKIAKIFELTREEKSELRLAIFNTRYLRSEQPFLFKYWQELNEEIEFIFENKGFEIAADIDEIKIELMDEIFRIQPEMSQIEQYSFQTYLLGLNNFLDIERIKEGIEEEFPKYLEEKDLNEQGFKEYEPKISYDIIDFNDDNKIIKTIYTLEFEEKAKIKRKI